MTLLLPSPTIPLIVLFDLTLFGGAIVWCCPPTIHSGTFLRSYVRCSLRIVTLCYICWYVDLLLFPTVSFIDDSGGGVTVGGIVVTDCYLPFGDPDSPRFTDDGDPLPVGIVDIECYNSIVIDD